MKNPWESFGNTKKTEEKVAKLVAKKEELDFPLSNKKGMEWNDNLLANMAYGAASAVASLKNKPESMMVGLKIKLLEQKLKLLYARDQKEAQKLITEYNALLETATANGNYSKLQEFEKEHAAELGMNKDNEQAA